MAIVSTLFFMSLFINSILALPFSNEPTPATWPKQFHALLFQNVNGTLSMVDLWYDWVNGRNFNMIQDQLDGEILYDLEWNNGTSFYYKLNSAEECTVRHFEVGILRPNWLDGASYLGQREMNGFLCNVWEKVDFIVYYEDVITKRPVYWVFFTGMQMHVMKYEVGVVLDDEKWQAPDYCFDKNVTTKAENLDFFGHLGRGSVGRLEAL